MKKILLLCAIAGVGLSVALFAASRSASAQEGPPPEFLVTWQAHSYVPPSYAGRALPRNDAVVDFAFELIDNGKLTDLRDYEVRWYLGNELIRSGKGLQSITIAVPMIAPRSEVARVTVVDYQGEDLDGMILLPVAAPEAIIDVPYPQHKIPRQGALIRALPYYFSVSNKEALLFEWRANNEPPIVLSENTDELVFSFAGGAPGENARLELKVVNGTNELEFAAAAQQLSFQ